MNIIVDILYALRQLKKSPKFTLLIFGVLAGGLAVSLFTFAFLYTFLFKPLPLPDQGGLYRASLHWNSDIHGESRYFPAYEFSKVKDKFTVFENFGTWQTINANISQGENSRIVKGARADWSMFSVSKTEAFKGRTLQASDTEQGQAPVAVISYSLWQVLFAASNDIVGKQILVNGTPTAIVGVMPEGYKFPESHDIWLPMSQSLLSPPINSNEKLEFFARLNKGVSVEQAERQLFVLVSDAFDARSAQMPGVELLRSEVGLFQQFNLPTTFKNISYFLIAISVFILLLACINVGNLLFARSIERNKETAIRSALGASQWRLITQQMWEGLIITIVGGLTAILLVSWALALVDLNMQSMLGSELSFWYRWGLDLPVVLVALAFMVFTIFAACFLPAFKAARQDFNAVLKDGTKGAQGKGAGKLSKVLVTLQIILISSITMFGAILSVKVNQLTDIDVGIDLKNLYYTEMALPHKLYPDENSRIYFYNTFNQRLSQQSEFVGSSVRFKFKRLRVAIDGVDYIKETDKPKIAVYGLIGSPEFMGPRLIQGRLFDLRDDANTQRVTVVSESMANKYWPNDSAIGKRVQIAVKDKMQWYNVIGVVTNISRTPLEKPHQYDELFVSGLQHANADAQVFFKYRSSGANAENVFFDTLKSVDSLLDVTNVEDYAHEVGVVVKMTGTIRDTIIGSGVFALMLAISGIYGLTSFAIAKRTHEIGVRRALGAKDSEIVKLFLKQGGWQVSIGLTIGIGFALLIFLAAGRFIALPQSTYVVTVVSVVLLLSTIILAAIIVPTKKATDLEPSAALRYE